MAEPDEIEVAAPVENVNPRDAVNDDVRAAIASLTAGDEGPAALSPADPEAPVADAEPAAPQVERARGPDGKFAKTPEPAKDAAPAKAAAPVDPKSPPPEDPVKASVQPSTAGAPPTSWAAEAKAGWATLPPAIQNAVLKREQEASNGFREYSERTKAYERALSPVAQEAQRLGLNVEQGLQRLMDGHRFLEAQPAQAILWLAQKHGLNLAELASNPPAPQPAARTEAIVPPQFLEQVSSLEQRFNLLLADQNKSAVDAFAADSKNAHYAAVEEQLPDIMRELRMANPQLLGVPLLQAAYDRAVWLNPEVRDKMIAEQHAQQQAATAAKVAEKANQARRAAVSVRGSNADLRPPPKPNGAAGDHVTNDVRAAIEQLRAH